MPTFDESSRSKLEAETPVCRHLRTKEMYVQGQDVEDAYVTSRSSPYHCLRTQFVTGPDDAPCLPELCQPTRDCFVAR
jgi:hypothetical protein